MKLAALEKRLGPGDRILLDTSALSAYFSTLEAVSLVAGKIVDDFVQTGRNFALVSTITAMELFVRPLRVAPQGFPHVHTFLTHWPNLSLRDVDLQVAQEAATLRATYNFSVPDALIIATGIVNQVAHLVTNDKAWATKLKPVASRVKIALLGDYA
jgi:predicted nucleic acid-binding protein